MIVLWQVFSYTLIGIGEIFAVSSAYEVAFTTAPPERKAQASAVNLFCVGGLPNILCIGLYQVGARWFTNSRGTTEISNLEDYCTAHVYKYFLVLFVICILGVVVNLLPAVKNWVASIEEEAAEALKTPMATPKMGRKPIRDKLDEFDVQERTALVKAKKHANYLKYGSGPSLYKQGSFRAGPLDSTASANKEEATGKVCQVWQWLATIQEYTQHVSSRSRRLGCHYGKGRSCSGRGSGRQGSRGPST